MKGKYKFIILIYSDLEEKKNQHLFFCCFLSHSFFSFFLSPKRYLTKLNWSFREKMQEIENFPSLKMSSAVLLNTEESLKIDDCCQIIGKQQLFY